MFLNFFFIVNIYKAGEKFGAVFSRFYAPQHDFEWEYCGSHCKSSPQTRELVGLDMLQSTLLTVTDVLDVDTSAIDLERAINDLPSMYPETVTVTSSELSNGRRFAITFNSELGKLYCGKIWLYLETTCNNSSC